MDYLWILLAFLVGCFIPFQSIITANLSKQIEHPFGAAFINFFGGMLVFALFICASSVALPTYKKMATIPWYLFTGGIIGSLFIFGALFALPKIGASSFFAQVVLGQLIMTIFLDHFGVLGLPIYRITSVRIFGVALLISGAFLILKK